MKRNTRPTPPRPGNHGLAPATPHRVAAADPIDDIIRSLEDTWHLGLQVRGVTWSPSTGPRTKADTIYGRIKFLYYSDRRTLNQSLSNFELWAPKAPHAGRLDLLLGVLPPNASPNPSLRQAPMQSPRGGTSRTLRSQLSTQIPQPIPHEDARSDQMDSYTTAPELPGSPTDDDDDDAMPPSPTTTSKSAQRRVQASPRVSSGSVGRKRLSDSYDNGDSSPKLSKTSKGKQPAEHIYAGSQGTSARTLFKIPSLDALRSFQSTSLKNSFTNSMSTSFNTNSTPMSSQQATQPFTANTSFTSDMGDTGEFLACEDATRPKTTRTSSTTMGSGVDEDDWNDVFDLSKQIEKEMAEQREREALQSSGNLAIDHPQSSSNMTRESSSTFGSIDEEELLHTSFQVEDTYRLGVDSSPTRPFLRSDSARLRDLPLSPNFQPSASRAEGSLTGPVSRSNISSTSGSPARYVLQPRGPRPVGSPVRAAIPPAVSPALASSTRTGHPKAAELPSRHVLESAHITKKDQSPTRMSHLIRRLPEQNLFVEDIPKELQQLPYFILFICRRIATERKVSMQALTANLGQQWSDPDSFWQVIIEQCPQAQADVRESRSLWSAQKRAFDGHTFKGQVVLNKGKKEPVFKLKLLPVTPDLSCRFQRRFGADRFLFLGFPSFDSRKQPKPARFTQDEMKNIQECWTEWFHEEHSFLGRKWRAFHIEPIKKKGGLKDDASDKRVVLFATEGCGINTPMSVGEMIDWFFPFAMNGEQNFCKAFARLDLGLSRTTPTLDFKPSQVRYVPDIKSDGTLEDARYNDRRLSWNETYEEGVVMNDGCALMSVGAALEIWERYKKVVDTGDPMPSAFQGRIGGAKGMWIVSAVSYSRNRDHQSVWIEINDSQKKFEPHPEDLFDTSPYDPYRLTFEVCAYSSQPSASDLHVSFIPILNDRGVPKEVLTNLVTERLDLETAQLMEMLPDPLKVYTWVFKQSSITQQHEEVRWQAALPHTLPDKIKLLVESGLDPTEAPYLARCMHRFIKQEQLWMEQKLRIPLGKAAFLYGVADPLGVLGPGEVHIQFSRPFVDDTTEESFRYLNDIDLLVARQPACRRSDMQKVRATIRPELAHLVDVVVFSSRGQYPLAGKLQGGDYDGDIFWLCWEQCLVEPFQNAPPPIQALDPLQYGIKKDKRQLHDIMDTNNMSTVDLWLKEIMTFRINPSLLGIVTNFLEKQAYKENRVHSSRLNALYDMHDLLVDAPKNAYTFTEQDWNKFVRFDLRCGKPRVPAYKAAMEACEKVREMGEVDHWRAKEWKVKADNIIDHLYFNIVRKHDVATLKMVEEAFPKDIDDDPILRYPYLAVQERNHSAMEAELKNLRTQIQEVFGQWNRGMKNDSNHSAANNYNLTVEECYKTFRSLLPTQLKDPEIASWLRPYLFEKFNMWETLRASVLYTMYPKKIPFVWHMAGRELADLKCRSQPGSRSICWPIHRVLRPRLVKVPRRFEDDSSDEEYATPTEDIAREGERSNP